ncbi:CBL-interacting protein kinase 4 [Ananas comosus]|uniref:CBL-interacting protein kinase 4 n=1 Tax=Ananas comosus TaxID=4615 RepID=A0A199VBM4_ANACO|nr:CBL-interacting protein kinase 4 [Ananas comosus]
MRGLSHLNVLRLLEVMATRSKIYLVTCREEAEARATARARAAAGSTRARRGGGRRHRREGGLQRWRRGRGRAPAMGGPGGCAGSTARRGVCEEAEARATTGGADDSAGRRRPRNLLLACDGVLKLSDFGIATLAEQRGRDGRLRTACGTPAYAMLCGCKIVISAHFVKTELLFQGFTSNATGTTGRAPKRGRTG